MKLLTALVLATYAEKIEKIRQLDVEQVDDESRSDSFITSIRLNPNINPEKRLNKLIEFSGSLLDVHFADWKSGSRLKKNFERLGGKMLAAYQRCGPDREEPDDDTDQNERSEQNPRLDDESCKAVKQVTTGFSKWADRFMSDCGSYKKNSHIPNKMKKFKKKLVSRLQKEGKCMDAADEFTKPKSGQIVKRFDKLGPDFKVKFDLNIKSAMSSYSNILFATSANANLLSNASFDDLLKQHGNINHDASYPAINRHPGIWINPGKSSDETAGLTICAEYVKWENVNGRPLDRCFTDTNIDVMKPLKINTWYEIEFEQFCWIDDDYYDYYDYYYDYRSDRFSVSEGCDTRISVRGDGVNFSYQHTLGNRMDAFQTHSDVVVYGGLPSNTFPAANVKVQNFEFENKED